MYDIISKLAESIKHVYKEAMLFIVVLLFASLIRCYDIAEHFIGYYEGWNGSLFSIVALNHITYGFQATKFLDVINSYLTTPDYFHYYINHPPLVGILVSISFRIFGIHEWGARLVPVLFSIGTLILLYTIVKKTWNEKIAFFSSFFFAFMPMAAYFGRMVCHEPIVLFFVLLSIYSYIQWRETYKKIWFGLMIFGFVLGGLSDWPAYYIVALLFIHYLLSERNITKNAVLMWIFLIIGILLLFISYLAYVSYITGSIEPLLGSFIYRTSSTMADNMEAGSFTIYQLFSREWCRIWQYVTPVIILLSFIWLGNFVTEVVRKKNCQRDSYVLLLFVFGLIHILLFKQGAWIHDYWLYYLTPAFAISAALGIELIQKEFEQKTMASKLQAKTHIISIITILILSMFLVQAIPFTIEIYGRDDPQTHELGSMINKKTNLNESVMTTISYAWVPGVQYYAQRYIHMVDDKNGFQNAMNDSTKSYRYFIVDSDILKHKDLTEDLFDNYSFVVEKHWVVFNLTEKIVHSQLISNMSSYRMIANFSDRCQLLGYNISNLDEEGTIFYVAYYWQLSQQIDANYTIFVHFTNVDGNPIFQQNHLPVYGMYQTSEWKPGEIIKDEYFVYVPKDVPSGTYNIRIGLWNPLTNERLPIDRKYSDGTDRVIIGNITIAKGGKN